MILSTYSDLHCLSLTSGIADTTYLVSPPLNDNVGQVSLHDCTEDEEVEEDKGKCVRACMCAHVYKCVQVCVCVCVYACFCVHCTLYIYIRMCMYVHGFVSLYELHTHFTHNNKHTPAQT